VDSDFALSDRLRRDFFMRKVLISPAASERLSAATQFLSECLRSAEIYVIGGTRAAADEFVRQYGRLQRATFGIHRLSLVQLAARISVLRLAANDQTPCSALSTEATVMRAVNDAYNKSIANRQNLRDKDGITPR
jgi:ATP-dependent helicase/nuclease subunit B